MDEKYIEIEHRLTEVENRAKSNAHRLDSMEEKQKDISDLLISVKELALETKHMREDLNKTIERLGKLENKDSDKWEKFKWIILTGVVTAILGYLLGTVGIH